ncbi:MAG: transglycosylase SLT domain-containing protein [Chloroflexota bacterium]
MPRARTNHYIQAAAATPEEASGCSFFVIPPLAVILISAVLAVFALNSPYAVQTAESRSPALDPASASAPAQPAEASMLTSKISPVFTREIQYWGPSISKWAAAANLDPNLAATVMQIESCGDPRALSRSGAIGLFQVMPFHFHASDSPYTPDTNAARGLAYLARSLATAGGDARLALAGYNGGIGVITRGEWTWSAQTKRYVQYGWPIFQDAGNGSESSEAVQEWYNRYGAGLCRQAADRLGLP